jgi:DNA-binding PadR family transcriptional regulator
MLMQDSIRKDFWQGILKLYILIQASKSPIYGEKIKKQLHECGYKISSGTLYPILHNLEIFGLCKSHIRIFRGRARKYYHITEQGKVFLEEMRTMVASVLQLLTVNHAEAGADFRVKEPNGF